MNAREQSGLLIAATSRIQQRADGWSVPSQAGNGTRYTVRLHPDQPSCNCSDHELSGQKCKHIYAVEFALKREQDGEPEIVADIALDVAKKKRPTYSQKWSAYNLAQTNEKDHFLQLLHDLCSQIKEPPRTKTGRKPIPLASAIFAACYKVYSTVSGRRFMSDLRDAQARGYVEACPCYNSIFNYLDNEDVTPILMHLITQSSLPLKTVETDFACDSSGFTSSRFVRWFDAKWGKLRTWHHWVKVQLMCGVKTNIVTAVELPDGDGADSPFLPALVRATERNFKLKTVCADKGYSAVDCLKAIDDAGAMPFIPFKSTATGYSGGLWKKMFHYFQYRREDFLRHYHKRSNVESTFSMIKGKFGDGLRSKSDVSMRNEILAKILCHNVCRIIHAHYELGISPDVPTCGKGADSAEPVYA